MPLENSGSDLLCSEGLSAAPTQQGCFRTGSTIARDLPLSLCLLLRTLTSFLSGAWFSLKVRDVIVIVGGFVSTSGLGLVASSAHRTSVLRMCEWLAVLCLRRNEDRELDFATNDPVSL